MFYHPFYKKVKSSIETRKTSLCIGLDPDIDRLPDHIDKSLKGLQRFLFDIIDVTHDICIAYKPNISFFESLGIDGLRLLEKVRKRIPDNLPVIIDGKRGDIGNTSMMQARYIFDYFGADATTLHPYMGLDSLHPFFSYKDRFNFVLALTSNHSAVDIEKKVLCDDQPLYMHVASLCSEWNKTYSNIGLVAGATQKELSRIRNVNKDLIFLIPGIGTQGGSYKEAVETGRNSENIAVINVSRSILYCSKELDYLIKVRKKTETYIY
ncbi:MAG: orotidine-5'-phosphate decarboxylase [bacterium]|nr:orotidine-5'-phosphate decarboxylase [bacterium]